MRLCRCRPHMINYCCPLFQPPYTISYILSEQGYLNIVYKNCMNNQVINSKESLKQSASRAAESARPRMHPRAEDGAGADPGRDAEYMRLALQQARKALRLGEVPIGCVIVLGDQVIGRGYNRRNTDHSVLAHAEIAAIRKACRRTGDWRLEGCTLYVTLEPCQMCAGAIVQSRIDRVVFGASSPKAGCSGTLLNILQNGSFNHQCELRSGVLAEQSAELLQQFFRALRERNRAEKALRTGMHTPPRPPAED